MKQRQRNQPKYIPMIQTYGGRWYLVKIDHEGSRFVFVNERQQTFRLPLENNNLLNDLKITNKSRIKKIENLGGIVYDHKREWEQLY